MKGRRGRPRKLPENRVVVRLTLHLWNGEDDDLIDFFKQIPTRRRAAYVKTALRSGKALLVSPSAGADDEELLADMAEGFIL